MKMKLIFIYIEVIIIKKKTVTVQFATFVTVFTVVTVLTL